MKKRFLLPFLLGMASATSTTPTLHYQTQPVPLLGGKVMVQASPSLRYLDPADARRVIVDLWGNPPESADDVLGMLVPGTAQPGGRDGWAIVMTENRDGHVSDSDAASTNYDQLLSDMQAGIEDRNTERVKAGYEAIRLVGWAEPPSYDPQQHKMIWAKELAFGDAGPEDHSLNYAVRVLGRDDVLELNAVGASSQLAQIRQGMTSVLPLVTFTSGSRYEDFNEGSDRLAAYGLAGLVAGGVVAKKVGLLALLPLLLKKGWILIVALLGLVARIKGFVQSRIQRPSAAAALGPVVANSTGARPAVHPDLEGSQIGRVSLEKSGDPRHGGPLGRHEQGD